MVEFEKTIKELQPMYMEFKEILIVILYGSVARGDYSKRHSDLDLLVVVKEKKPSQKLKNKIIERIDKISLRSGVDVHVEFQGLVINDDDKSLLRKMIEEGRVVYASGVWYFDGLQLGLNQYLLYTFSTKNSRKGTMFSKTIHGKKSWYYKGNKKIVKTYPGLADGNEIILLGRGTLMVDKRKQKDMIRTFQNFGIQYTQKKIIYA